MELFLWSMTAVSLTLGFVAVFLAAKSRKLALTTSTRVLQARIAEIESTLEKVLATEEKLLARLRQRERRAKSKNGELDPSDPVQWKKDMRKKLAFAKVGLKDG